MRSLPSAPDSGWWQPLREHQRWLIGWAVCVLLTYAYFVPAPGWNQNSRLALTRALVESGTTVIDANHETTGDKSFRDGHFYSDKAPGTSLAAAVPYAAFYALRRITGSELPAVHVRPLDPRDRAAGIEIELADREAGDVVIYNRAFRLALYLCGLVAVAVPSVGASATVFLLAYVPTHPRSSGDACTRNRNRATWIALCYGLGTPALTYSTALYGHQLCAACLIIAFALLVLGTPQAGSRKLALAVGASLGMAVLTEYPAAVPAVLLTGFAAIRHGPRQLGWVVAGGVPFALGLAAYHTAAFGHPLATGYDFVYREEFALGMAHNYGLGLPDPQAALALLFGSYRGLFYLSPILLLAAWGMVAGLGAQHTQRAASLVALVIVLYFWLLNAGYYMWDGGASAGPRHMVPAIPFLILGLRVAWPLVPRACVIIGAVSAAQAVLLAAGSPEAAQFGDPLWEFAIDRLLDRSVQASTGASNLGAMLGFPGPASLLPLAAIWLWVSPRMRTRDPSRR